MYLYKKNIDKGFLCFYICGTAKRTFPEKIRER